MWTEEEAEPFLNLAIISHKTMEMQNVSHKMRFYQNYVAGIDLMRLKAPQWKHLPVPTLL